jgi:hypothetical protein
MNVPGRRGDGNFSDNRKKQRAVPAQVRLRRAGRLVLLRLACRGDLTLGAEEDVVVVDVPLLDFGDLRRLAACQQPSVDGVLLV